jgi:hypothetical protein
MHDGVSHGLAENILVAPISLPLSTIQYLQLEISLVLLSNMALGGKELMKCTSFRRVTAAVLLSSLIFSSGILAAAPDQIRQAEAQHIFQLPVPTKDELYSMKDPDIHRFVCLNLF